MNVGTWSFGTVLLVSALWVALDVAVVALVLFLTMRRPMGSTGSGGIGAVSGSLGILSAAAFLLGPPILLTLIWFLLRR